MIQWFLRLFGKGPKPTLEEEAMQDAQDIDREILVRELRLIDEHHRLEAYKQKKQFLIDWLQRDLSRSVGRGPN